METCRGLGKVGDDGMRHINIQGPTFRRHDQGEFEKRLEFRHEE
jgi:hypothetical protein